MLLILNMWNIESKDRFAQSEELISNCVNKQPAELLPILRAKEGKVDCRSIPGRLFYMQAE